MPDRSVLSPIDLEGCDNDILTQVLNGDACAFYKLKNLTVVELLPYLSDKIKNGADKNKTTCFWIIEMASDGLDVFLEKLAQLPIENLRPRLNDSDDRGITACWWLIKGASEGHAAALDKLKKLSLNDLIPRLNDKTSCGPDKGVTVFDFLVEMANSDITEALCKLQQLSVNWISLYFESKATRSEDILEEGWGEFTDLALGGNVDTLAKLSLMFFCMDSLKFSENSMEYSNTEVECGRLVYLAFTNAQEEVNFDNDGGSFLLELVNNLLLLETNVAQCKALLRVLCEKFIEDPDGRLIPRFVEDVFEWARKHSSKVAAALYFDGPSLRFFAADWLLTAAVSYEEENETLQEASSHIGAGRLLDAWRLYGSHTTKTTF